MPLNAENLRARILGPPEGGKPFRPAAQNLRHHGDGFNIIHRGWAAIKPNGGREWRLQPRHALLAFQAFNQRGFFTANISPCPAMHVKIEIPASACGIPPQQTSIIGFLNRRFEDNAFVVVFTANIDVAGMRPHRETRDQAAFDQRMRIMANDIAILAGAGFRFISIHHQIGGSAIGLLRHEGPFHAGREARAASATQAGILDAFNHRIATARNNRRRTIPIPAHTRRRQIPGLTAIEVLENPILISERHVNRLPGRSIRFEGLLVRWPCGQWRCRAWAFRRA